MEEKEVYFHSMADKKAPDYRDTSARNQAAMDEAYYDRNQAAMLAAKLATRWPVLYIELPTGQVSWHIPEAEAVNLQLPYERHWDGHTVEKKRERIDDFISVERKKSS